MTPLRSFSSFAAVWLLPLLACADEPATLSDSAQCQRLAAPSGPPGPVVATVLGHDIHQRDIEPPPEWFKQREQHLQKHGETPGLVSGDEYRRSKLTKLIWDPLVEAYGKDHETNPTEEELQEFIVRFRQAKHRQEQERTEKLSQLPKEIEQLQQQMQSTGLSDHDQQLIQRKIDTKTKELDADRRAEQLEKETASRTGPDYERFFAEWSVGHWKLQQAFYRQYGGRVIWQQVGPEAYDAMRDFLKEREGNGSFSIYDADLRKVFWEPFTKDKPGVLVSQPDRIFEHPWSGLE